MVGNQSLEFLTMVRDNLVMESQKQMSGNNPEIATLDFDVHTPYDNHEKELDQMYNRFFGSYMKDMLFNRYQVPKATENNATRYYTRRFTLRCLLRTYTKYAESIRLRRTQLWPDRKDSDIAYSRLSQLPGSYARCIPFLHDRSRKKKDY